MKFAKVFVANGAEDHASWLREGFKQIGWRAESPANDADVHGDLVVMWGWRRPDLVAKAAQARVPILVLEHGHLPPRNEWVSMGIGGLSGLATYADPDNGDRFDQHWGHLLSPWRNRPGRVLVIGQCEGDASLHCAKSKEWAAGAMAKYQGAGHHVVYRPHPKSRRDDWPLGVEIEDGVPLDVALESTALCVTYTSTAGVEAVLAGVPVVTCHPGSMAWPVTSHGLLASPVFPDRRPWAAKLAWTQFSPTEIASGFALASLLPSIGPGC